MADFKAASSAISDLKVGSTAVQKVYAGADLVWSPAATSDWEDAWASSDFVGSYVSNGNSGSQRQDLTLVTGDSLTRATGTVYDGSGYHQNTGGDSFQVYLDHNLYDLWYTYGYRWIVWYFNGNWYKQQQTNWYDSVRLTSIPNVNFFGGSGTEFGAYSPVVTALFKADPGNVSSWTNYDGPVDDWHKYADGVFYGATDGSMIVLNEQVASSQYFTPEKLDKSGGNLRFRVWHTTWPASGDNSIYPPYIACYYNNAWTVFRWETNGLVPGLQNYQARWVYYDGASNPGVNALTGTGPTAVVYLTQYATGDYADWQPYWEGTGSQQWHDEAVAINTFNHTQGYLTLSSYIEDGVGTNSSTEEFLTKTTGAYFTNMRFRSRTSSDQSPNTNGIQFLPPSGGSGNTAPFAAAFLRRDGSSLQERWHEMEYVSSETTNPRWYKFLRASDSSTGVVAANNNVSPQVVARYTSRPANVKRWGDIEDWDTQANGVFMMKALDGNKNNGNSDLVTVPGYTAHTFDAAMDDHIEIISGSTSAAGGVLRTPRNTPTENADSPPYIAIYIHKYHEDQGGTNSNAKGWYVFKRPASIPTVTANMDYTPYAWPSDISNGYNNAYVTQGALGNGGSDGYGYVLAFLDDYSGIVGAGGTDHWTLPPTIHSDLRYNFNNGAYGNGWLTDTSSNTPNPVYGGMPGTAVGFYHWNPYRGTFLYLRDLGAAGTVTYKAYYQLPNTTNHVFMGEGSYTFTGGGVKQLHFSTNSQFSGNSSHSNYLFNTITYGSRMSIVITHHPF